MVLEAQINIDRDFLQNEFALPPSQKNQLLTYSVGPREFDA